MDEKSDKIKTIAGITEQDFTVEKYTLMVK